MQRKSLGYRIYGRILKELSQYLSDRLYLKLLFKHRLGYSLNLDNPRSFNEKLQWLKLNDIHSEYTQMVDKVDAKKIVASIIGDEYMTETVYNEENMRVLLFYVIIPLIAILILFFIGTKIYEHFNKNKDENRTNFVINYWSNVMGVIFTAILLSVSIGFSLAFTENVRALNAVDENIVFYYFFMVFPVFPLIFLIYYICKFIINIRKKEKLDEESEEDEQ